ncbi:MAG: peptide deformylase [Oscillospiraceae bacterium]|nr:peptide deformylase [Oscillospiraceae bacterium]
MICEICRDVKFLKRKSLPATEQDAEVIQNLRDTLRANRERCVGMAANMIGVNKRIIIFSTGILEIVMVNPKITAKSDAFQTTESCLSLTGERRCRRYRTITVAYQDSHFQKKTGDFSGFTAQIIQHECDHLEGIII